MRHQSVFSSTMNASVVHGVVQIDYIAVFISPAVLVTFGNELTATVSFYTFGIRSNDAIAALVESEYLIGFNILSSSIFSRTLPLNFVQAQRTKSANGFILLHISSMANFRTGLVTSISINPPTQVM